MSIADLLRWILTAVSAQRRRTALTIIGFSTGIAAVVLLNSIGESLRQYILQEFTQFGSHIVVINPGKTETFGLGGILNTIRPPSLADAESLTTLPEALQVVPVVMGTARIKSARRARYTDVAGVGPLADQAWKLTVAKGRFLPADDIQRPRSFAVIGSKLKHELFAGENAIGAYLHIGSQRFRVVGVLASKGEFMGMDLDDMIYIPAAKALQLFNRESLMEVDIFYKPGTDNAVFAERVRELLIRRHGREDFTLITQDDMLKSLDKILQFIKIAAGGLGMISLLVGAVGIITILTITVSERAQEIGLLRALGFAPQQIRRLFLGEAIALALISGLLGYLGSMSLLFIVQWLLPQIPVDFSLPLLLFALVLSAVIGALAGWRPAQQAARLEPVRALRDEN